MHVNAITVLRAFQNYKDLKICVCFMKKIVQPIKITFHLANCGTLGFQAWHILQFHWWFPIENEDDFVHQAKLPPRRCEMYRIYLQPWGSVFCLAVCAPKWFRCWEGLWRFWSPKMVVSRKCQITGSKKTSKRHMRCYAISQEGAT